MHKWLQQMIATHMTATHDRETHTQTNPPNAPPPPTRLMSTTLRFDQNAEPHFRKACTANSSLAKDAIAQKSREKDTNTQETHRHIMPQS